MSGSSYNPWLLSVSMFVGMSVSYVALHAAASSTRGRERATGLWLIGAAAVMGAGLWSMHFIGMLAMPLPQSGSRGAAAALTVCLLVLAMLALLCKSSLERSRAHHQALEQATGKLEHSAMHDALTDLPNRVMLAQRIEQAIARAARDGSRFATLLIDLDHFKAVNDSLGHAAGDELLMEVARRLRAAVRSSDILARFGGDEFVLLLNELSAVSEIEGVIRSVCECLNRPIDLGDLEVHVSLSVGVSIYPSDGTDRETLLKHADAAMYTAKRAGRNGFEFYKPAMNAFTRDRLVLENELRRAVRASEFQLVYQPQASTADGRVESVEALIRWNHPRRGLLPPAAFIGLAEESGLILPMGDWVLREACRQASAWRAGGRPLRVAVNLSAQQLRQKELPDKVHAALAASGLAPQDLELELTESVVMQEAESSIRTLQRLSERGVSIAVDDFGTGYSSLSYLRRLPLRRLKIDRSFVRDILTSREDAEIVRAIISLAGSLNLQVIAEGVETSEQLQALVHLGCANFQGYFCSPPVAAAQVWARIADWERSRAAAAPPAALGEPFVAAQLLALGEGMR